MREGELLDIIDDHNQVIGYAPKADVYRLRLSHRVVHTLVVDPSGRLCVIKRARQTSDSPSDYFYSSPAAGHVRAGEPVEQAALRELEHQTGLKGPIAHVAGFDFKHSFTIRIELFLKILRPAVDKINLNVSEFSPGQFYSSQELSALAGPIMCPQLERCLYELRCVENHDTVEGGLRRAPGEI